MSNTIEAAAPWRGSRKIAFRFLFLTFILFIAFVNNGAYPFWDLLMRYPTEGLHLFIPWVAKEILNLPYEITVFTNGSGDTTYDYLITFLIFLIATVGTIIWSLLDAKRKSYDKLYYWLTVAVRFYVGLMLINYGLVKVFKLQFPSPGLYRLMQPYGDSSPMGLAWTFLGFSSGYNFFMGMAELAAGLLLFRRTMTVGAIITLATTANVMAVNYFYDVPVKIVSTALFLMTLFLLMNDWQRLISFFLKGETVNLPVIPAPVFERKWKIAKIVFKSLVIGYVLLYGGYETFNYLDQYGESAPKTRLYGLYHVETFVKAGDTLPPLTTDSARWRAMTIEWETFARVKHMNDSINGFRLQVDTTAQTMSFTLRGDTIPTCTFNYHVPDPEHFVLTGRIRSDSVAIAFRRFTDIRNRFRLTNRSFHWINEYPYNR